MTALSVKFLAATNVIIAAASAFGSEECPEVLDLFAQNNKLKVEDINDILGCGRTALQIKAALVIARHWDEQQYQSSSATSRAIYEAQKSNDVAEEQRLEALQKTIQYSDRETRVAAVKVLECLLQT